MSKHGMWVKVALVGLFCAAVAQADHATGHEGKGFTKSGSFEGGYGYNWGGGATDSNFLVDHATLNMTGTISDKTSVVINNAFSVNNGAVAATTGARNARNYFSGAVLAVGGFAYANQGAYLQHKCSDNVTTSIGHLRNPFGMEGLWSRYDMPTYYYSAAYTTAQGYGWNYDLGVKFTLTDILPGSWEIAVLDGQADNQAGENFSVPSAAIRWVYEMKGGDWSFSPVVSAHFGRWHGAPEDMGITAGGMFKSGGMWANLEWVMANRNLTPTGTTRAKAMSIYVEPGMDLGMAEVSLKGEFASADATGTGTNTTDFNVGVAVGKTYTEKYRIRALYQHTNLGGKLGAHNNDFRLLFGTKW